MLNLFLGPGVAVMDRLRFGWKLLLVALLIAVPVLYLGWNYTSDLTAGIAVPQKQRVGADVVKAAGDLMKEIQRHRGTASRVLNGDGTAKQALAEYQAGADRAATALDLLVAQHGQSLQITEMWAGLKGEWRQLVQALSGMTAAQSLEAHTALIQQVQVLIEEVADASALNTNAVLDEFHLASLTTRTLLPLTESLGQLRATGSGVATRQLLSPDERIRLAILRAESESGLKRAKTSLELTYRSNAQVRDVLDPVAARTTTLAIGYLGMLETKLVKAEKVTVGGQIVFDEGTRAVDGVYALQDAAIAELDRLLDARIAKFQVRRVLALGLTGGALGLAAYFLLVFAVSSIRNLRIIEAASRQMQQGDLRIGRLPVRSRDEIGQVAGALSETAERLGQVIAEVTDSLNAVQSAAGRLSSTSGEAAESTRGAARSLEQLTGGVAEQAEAVDQVTRTMAELQEAIGQIALGSQDVAGQVQGTGQDLERMAHAMQQVAASAGRVRASTDEAAASARGGAGVADQTVAGMKRIELAVGDTAGRMRDLAQASAQIGAITEAISEIAEQTNLLALNAAIEAARAGEHGKGFAVVSEEVRRLAERSARSAREIDALVGGIQVRLAEAMRAMEAGTVEVGEGARLAERSGAALREILTAVEQAAAGVQAIVTAADRVRESVGQGLSAFQSVAAVTEENMASTEEMSAGAEQVGLSVERISGVARGNLEAAGMVSAAVAGMTELSGTVAASAAELDRVAGELRLKISVLKV